MQVTTQPKSLAVARLANHSMMRHELPMSRSLATSRYFHSHTLSPDNKINQLHLLKIVVPSFELAEKYIINYDLSINSLVIHKVLILKA